MRLPPGALPAAGALPDDGVTVLVPSAVLAPAPTPQVARPGEAPVFVNDSGSRKRMMRLAGVLIALLSIGFIAIVGVALAVPDGATNVGVAKVVRFMVPGAGGAPPQLSPLAPLVQVAQPKPKPVIVAAPTPKPKPVDADPTTTPPATGTSVAAAPTTTQAPTVTQTPVAPPPGGIQTGGTPIQGGQAPVVVNPPAADANAVGNPVVPADQAVHN